MESRRLHILFNPDGNRRYAREHELSYDVAYNQLAEKLAEIATWSFGQFPVKTLTFWYATKKHWNRSQEEVVSFVKAIPPMIKALATLSINEQLPIRIQLKGDLKKFYEICPEEREYMEVLMKRNEDAQCTINFLVSYDPQDDFVQAITCCQEAGKLPHLENIAHYMELPPVDVLIRSAQPRGFVKVSSYWPGLEKGRIISTQSYPQDIEKEEFTSIIDDFLDLKDSVEKVLEAKQIL